MEKIIEESVIFSNTRGERLWGILSLPKGKRKAPALIMCHGFNKTKSERKFVKLARILAQNGIAAFRFDFSGQGDSEGALENLSINCEVEDLKSAYETLSHRKTINKEKIGLLGHSLGALITVLFQAQYREAKTLILLSPALRQRELLKKWYLPKELKLGEKQGYLDTSKGRIGIQYLNEARERDWLEVVSQIDTPTLIIHGNKDDDVPIKYGKGVFKRLSGPRKMAIVKGADHHFENWNAFKKLTTLTLEWLRKHL